jgi:formiminotetrahydrofolate cyclodeaminase
MYDRNTSIASFLDAAAARQPAPGGGSVTALAGALAASMGEMVLAYSVGRKDLADHAPAHRAALGEFSRARRLLLDLMVEDQLAYETLSGLRRLPDDSPERREKYPAALLACIRVPQAMAATAVALLELADRIAATCNRWLLSDLAVCADLAMATARCAVYNIRVNLKDLPDPQDRTSIESQSLQVLGRAGVLIQQVSRRIWTRDAAGA